MSDLRVLAVTGGSRGSAPRSRGLPGVWIHYAASKGPIDTFAINLAKEVASEGIRVNAVRAQTVLWLTSHAADLTNAMNAIKRWRPPS